MEVSTTLMVVIMFTSIVGIGVANILMTFASTISSMSDPKRRPFGHLWLIILLLTFLSMFWNSSVLAGKESWVYLTFLYIIAGPITLLFASSLATRLLREAQESASEVDDARVLGRFFVLYAISNVWFIGVDFLLAGGWQLSSTISLLIAAASLVAAAERFRNWRGPFTKIMLLLLLVDVGLQSL